MTSVKITVGAPYAEEGITTVNIYANGTVSASASKNNYNYECKTRIEENQFSTLVSALLSDALQRGTARKKGLPDEVKYIFETTINDSITKTEMWDNDLNKYPAVKKIIVALRRDIYSKSEQKILL